MATETLVGGDLTYTPDTWASNRVVTGADGKFYVAYFSGGNNVSVQQWDGAQWRDYASFSAASMGAAYFGDDLDLAVDADGHLHIALETYYGTGSGGERGIAHGEFTGSGWGFSKVQTFSHWGGWLSPESPSIVLDQAGNPHIAFRFKNAETHTDYIHYATKTGTSWSVTTLATGTSGTGTDEMFYPWIGIDPDGTIHVTYTREDNQNDYYGNLYHTTKPASGGWTAPQKIIDGVAEGKDYSYESNFDTEGRLHVIVTETVMNPDWTVASSTVYEYVEGQGKSVLFTHNSGSIYATGYQEVGGVEYMLVARFSSDGIPQGGHIYTRQAGGAWTQGNAVDVPDSYELSLAVNQAGKAMVISLDTELDRLSYDTGNAGGVPVSLIPVITPGPGTMAYVENSTTAVDPSLTLTDPDSATLSSAQVAITGNFVAAQDVLSFTNTNSISFGNVVASYNAATGVLTLTSAGGTATLAQWQNVLRAVTYTNTSENPSTAARAISITVNDGSNVSAAATKTITVERVNDAPGFGGLDASPTYVEGSAAVALDGNVSLFDAELDLSNNWNGASVTLRRDGGANAQDVFEATGNLSLTGTGSGSVLVSGTTVGTYTMSGGQLTITFNAQATSALVDAVVQQIAYRNTSDDPPASVRIAWTVTDGGTADSQGGSAETTTVVTTVAITAVNDAPVLADQNLTLEFHEDSGPPVNGQPMGFLVSTLSGGISDPDGTSSRGIAIVGADAANGTWWFSTNNGASWTALGSPSETAARLLADNAATRLYFEPNANYNGTVPAGLTIRAWDLSDGSNGGTANVSATGTGGKNPFSVQTDTVSLQVTAVNDLPTATNLTQTKEFTEDGSAVSLNDIVVADVDTNETITATLTLSSPQAGSLSTGTFGTATSTFNAVTGVWSITGSVASVNAALAAVTFTPAANWDQDVTITTRIRDAAGTGPADGTITLEATAVSDAPTALGTTQEKSFTEDVPVSLDAIVVTDVDTSETITATLTLSSPQAGSLSTGTFGTATSTFNAVTGVWSITGSVASVNAALAAVTFIPAANWDQDVTITTRIRDAAGTGPADGTITLEATAVNDVPVATVPASIPVTEDTPTALTGISFSDVDAGSGPVTVTFSVPAGSLAATSGSGVMVGGTASALTLTGTIAAINAFIAASAITYTPAANDTATRVLTVSINDGGNSGSGGALSATTTVNLSVSAVNDAPVITVPSTISAHEDTPIALTGISVSDVDAGSGSVTVTITAASGSLAAISGGGVTIGGTSASLTLSGTVAAINAFIAGGNLTFRDAANASGAVTVTVTVDDHGNTGASGAKSAVGEFAIVVVPVNDAPTSKDGAVILDEDGAYTFTVADFEFADPNDVAAPNAFMAIVIDVLPTRGTLFLDGVTVTVGQDITIADINAGKFVFRPASNEHGGSSQYSGFTFRVRDNGGTANGGSDTSGQHEMRIDVTPVNDAAVIGGVATGSVTEDDTLVATGILTVTDVDAGEAGFMAQADVVGTYGTFSFDDTTGEWTYVLDNASAAVQALRQGEIRQETFIVRSLDGTERTVTVIVNGTKDIVVVDGVDVDREEVDNGDGTSSQTVTIPVVTAGRTETDGSASYADIPLVSAGGRNVLSVQLGAGIGLTASGFAAPRPAGDSLTDLIREIRAHTAAGSADRAALTGGGSGFLAGLPTSGPLLVQSIVATQSGPTSGVPLVISGSSDSAAPATALVIDARGLAAGTTIALQNVAFAAIIGSVRVTGGAGSQVVFGDSAGQHMVLGADDDVLHGGGGNDYVGSLGGNDRLYGDAGNDTVSGGIGHDSLYGGTGHDRLLGGSGNDRLSGETGNDTLDGGTGDDLLWGGSGVDRLIGGTGNDRLYGEASNDRLDGGSGHDRLDGGTGHDGLKGDSGNDMLMGASGNDSLWGGTGADRLDGGTGNDSLKGDSGNDWIVGGLGRDKLWGGSGADVFDFNSVAESRVGSQRDVIYDFQSGRDKIDLRGIDANERLKGDQAFTWIGTKGPFLYWHEAASVFMKVGFTGRAGELRYDRGILMGDTDGDGRADFEIKIVGRFSVGDVIL